MQILAIIHISNVFDVNPKDLNLFLSYHHNIGSCLILYFRLCE